MKILQTYQAGLIPTDAVDSAPCWTKTRGLMQRLGSALIACTLVLGASLSASAGQAEDEAAVRALGDTFADYWAKRGYSRYDGI